MVLFVVEARTLNGFDRNMLIKQYLLDGIKNSGPTRVGKVMDILMQLKLSVGKRCLVLVQMWVTSLLTLGLLEGLKTLVLAQGTVTSTLLATINDPVVTPYKLFFGHGYTDAAKTHGGRKVSGPSPDVSHKFTNVRTLGGVKDAGPSPGNGHKYITGNNQ
ncbi:hypothetical protein GIB67_025949 [Kingdonia uniflora]|uniref:Uncharacterized protein n=1 Tax=Kingdonia uniflora TaxID=39325 RepID=A0A7J7PBU0_9MAGN|nr:hypothetical protein GIB67_025949 [Kingdonia uniflora]